MLITDTTSRIMKNATYTSKNSFLLMRLNKLYIPNVKNIAIVEIAGKNNLP